MSPAFVGRSASLTAADTVLRQVALGNVRHLLVAGEAGIGKTRFANEVADLARAEGFLVLRGGCVSLGSGELPYAPLCEALRELPRRLDRAALAAAVGPDGGVLSRLVPTLGAWPGDGPPNPRGMERARLFEGLLGLLGRRTP